MDTIFNNKRYITIGVEETLPPILQVILWELIDGLKIEKDYLQIFTLSVEDGKQKLVHEQEQPEYRKAYELCIGTKIINGKVFVIDDKTHSTMLMNYEY